jgi:hypothetical protein
MGHSATNCKICPSNLKTIPHLFETCAHAKRSWSALQTLYANTGPDLKLPPQYSLIDALDNCLDKKPKETAHLQLIYSTLWTLWLSRNGHQFQGTPRMFSAPQVSQQADDNLYAVCTATKPSTKLHRLRKARRYILTTPNRAFDS